MRLAIAEMSLVRNLWMHLGNSTWNWGESEYQELISRENKTIHDLAKENIQVKLQGVKRWNSSLWEGIRKNLYKKRILEIAQPVYPDKFSI